MATLTFAFLNRIERNKANDLEAHPSEPFRAAYTVFATSTHSWCFCLHYSAKNRHRRIYIPMNCLANSDGHITSAKSVFTILSKIWKYKYLNTNINLRNFRSNVLWYYMVTVHGKWPLPLLECLHVFITLHLRHVILAWKNNK